MSNGNGNAEPGILAALEKIQSHIAASQQVMTHLDEDVQLINKRLEALEGVVRDLQVTVQELTAVVLRSENHARIATDALLRLRLSMDELRLEVRDLAHSAEGSRIASLQSERNALSSERRVEELLREIGRNRITPLPPEPEGAKTDPP